MVVKETYSFYSDDIPIIVNIESKNDEFVLVYNVAVSTISQNTEVILDKVRDELVTKIKLSLGEITDEKKDELVRTKFQDSVIYLLNKFKISR